MLTTATTDPLEVFQCHFWGVEKAPSVGADL